MGNTGIQSVRDALSNTPTLQCTQFKFGNQLEIGNAIKALRPTGAKLMTYGTTIRETVREFVDVVVDESTLTAHPDGSTTHSATCTVRDTTQSREVLCLVCITTNRSIRRNVESRCGATITWHSCEEVAEMLATLAQD